MTTQSDILAVVDVDIVSEVMCETKHGEDWHGAGESGKWFCRLRCVECGDIARGIVGDKCRKVFTDLEKNTECGLECNKCANTASLTFTAI